MTLAEECFLYLGKVCVAGLSQKQAIFRGGIDTDSLNPSVRLV